MSTMTNQTNSATQPPQDMRPAVVDDRTEAAQVSEERHEEVGAQHEEQAPTEPTRFVDPRDRIAAKQRARRETPTDETFYDEMGIPPEIRNKAPDEGDPLQQPTTQRGAQPAPLSDSGASQQNTGARLKLSVNHNTFEVSRADALRYAEIDAGEADLYNDVQIVRLAQKHLAAQQRLDEAKAATAAAKSAPSARAVPTPGQEGAENDGQGAQPSQPQQDHHSRRREVVESVLFEDPDVAAERLDQYVRETVENTLKGVRKQDVSQDIRREIVQLVSDAEMQHPDIGTDKFAAIAAREEIFDDVQADLQRIGVTPEQAGWLRQNGKLVDAYIAAHADGHQLRPPRELIDGAVTRTRASLEQRGYFAPRQQQQQPIDGAQSRIDAKRGLIQQPQRSMPTPQTQQRPQLSIEDSRKAAILQRQQAQRARFR